MKFNLRNQSGAAVVEFAVILPILVALAFGIIEFSILLYDKAMVTNASREGARVGIVFTVDNNGNWTWTGTEAKITNTVNSYLSTYLISLGSPAATVSIPPPVRAVNPDTGTYSPGGTLTVTVTYNYTFMVIPNVISNFFRVIIPNPIPLTATTVMRFE